MNCEKCFHSVVCHSVAECTNFNIEDNAEIMCENFEDKSQIIELPNVEIVQELFYIDGFTRTVEKRHCIKVNLGTN